MSGVLWDPWESSNSGVFLFLFFFFLLLIQAQTCLLCRRLESPEDTEANRAVKGELFALSVLFSFQNNSC